MDFILFGGNDASPTSGDPASAQPRDETLSEDVTSPPSSMVGESSPTSDHPVSAQPRDETQGDDVISSLSSMDRDACPISDKPALSLSLDKVSPTVPTRVCK